MESIAALPLPARAAPSKVLLARARQLGRSQNGRSGGGDCSLRQRKPPLSVVSHTEATFLHFNYPGNNYGVNP